MRLARLRTSALLTAAELARNRFAICLLLVIPILFFALVWLTVADKPVAFRLASVSRNALVEVSARRESLAFIAVAAAGLLASFLALNLIQRYSGANRRLVLCGYQPSELVLAKLFVLLCAVALIACYVTALLRLFFAPRHFWYTVLGIALAGFVHACYGLLAGAITRRELEGILLIVLLVNIDAGWLQNPIYYAEAQNKLLIRCLPAYFPSQASIISAFTGHSIVEPLIGSLIYGGVLLLAALLVYLWRMRVGRTRPLGLRPAAYGFLFLVVLPALLVVWAWRTQNLVRLPAPGPLAVGVVLGCLGAVLMLAGTQALYRYGHGLPMNPYPPVKYVSQGVYRVLPHPIYTGFSILCVGIAMAERSSSGLWLVSPAVALGCLALVLGYEQQDLRKRFGPIQSKPLIHLPPRDDTAPTFWDRLSVYILALLPWCLAIGMARSVAGVKVNLLAFAFVLPAPLVAARARDLRQFSVCGLIALAVSITVAAAGAPGAAMGASQVAWTFLAARVFAGRLPLWMAMWYLGAVFIALAGGFVDLLTGAALFLLVINLPRLWEHTRRLSERIANSWKEWRFGPVRVINHGFYAGAGVLAGLSIVGTLLGPGHIPAMLTVAASALITAGLWAQLVEGSPSLLRPYGYYGGVLGGILGACMAGFLGESPWRLLAAFSVAAPWIQSAGRLRCLVQGCCHGREAPATVGIRYTHPRSRVCRLAGLVGVPIHPAPVYSILWNVVIAMAVAKLWLLPAPCSLVAGTYLILAGLGRFVEESYRGEPQTPVRGGLPIYQWLAVASVLGGVFVTMASNTPATPDPHWNWGSLAAAAVFGAITSFALGVDFPGSNRRFSRLA